MSNKKYFNSKLKYMSLALLPVIVAPTITSCSQIRHKNFLASYGNTLDVSTALGITPDYYLTNSTTNNEDFLKPLYLKDYVSNQLVVKKLRIYDGDEVDTKSLARLEPKALFLNEWEKVDAYKFKGITDLVYTSMGDSQDQSRWWNETTKDINGQVTSVPDTVENWGFEPDTSMNRFYKKQLDYVSPIIKRFAGADAGVSPQKALLMGARDIDKLYKTNGLFEAKAKEINELTKQRIQGITKNQYFQTFLKVNNNQQTQTNINVGVVLQGADNNGNETFKLLNPNVLPMFYSTQEGKGLGFDFPMPNDDNWALSNYSATYVGVYKEEDKLVNEFNGKFDYLIYCRNTKKLDENGLSYQPDLTKVKGLLKNNSQQDVTQRIYISEYINFYEAVWAIIGNNNILDELIDKMIPQWTKSNNSQTSNELTNLQTMDKQNRINFPKKDKLKTIREDTDFSNTNWSWSYSSKNTQS